MVENIKTKVLLTLGNVKRQEGWPDYLQYGFKKTDVPALLEMIADASLNYSDEESLEVWAPLHAWRTIGQIGCPTAIPALINMFSDFLDDDWALTEFPTVMAMLGGEGIEPLIIYFKDTTHNEFCRGIAIDSLSGIAQREPFYRNQIIAYFQAYMKSPEHSATGLNGHLISCLIDLNAKDLITDIRRMYELGCVDLLCCGDIEEVEIEMGLRFKRSTPKPNYFKQQYFSQASNMKEPSGADGIELLDYFFIKYGNDDSILDSSELDGFFAALACSPETILPSLWMPALWGDESNSPEWESEDEFIRFSNAIFDQYNAVISEFNSDQYQALFLESEIDGTIFNIVDEWCEGFTKGLLLWGGLNEIDAAVVSENTEAILFFAGDGDLERRLSMSNGQIESMQKLIEPNVQCLFGHFSEARRKEGAPIVNKSPKIGRNDPCSCGSGKKFKKCCLH